MRVVKSEKLAKGEEICVLTLNAPSVWVCFNCEQDVV